MAQRVGISKIAESMVAFNANYKDTGLFGVHAVAKLLTYDRRIPFVKLFDKIDDVDGSTVKRVATRRLYSTTPSQQRVVIFFDPRGPVLTCTKDKNKFQLKRISDRMPKKDSYHQDCFENFKKLEYHCKHKAKEWKTKGIGELSDLHTMKRAGIIIVSTWLLNNDKGNIEMAFNYVMHEFNHEEIINVMKKFDAERGIYLGWETKITDSYWKTLNLSSDDEHEAKNTQYEERKRTAIALIAQLEVKIWGQDNCSLREIGKSLGVRDFMDWQRKTQAAWAAPRRGAYKLNTDGCFYEDTKRAGGGGVIRDSQGKHVVSYTVMEDRILHSSLEAEFMALLAGLQLLENKFPSVIVESDSALAIQFLSQGVSEGHPLENVVNQCTYLIKQHGGITLRWVPRIYNKVADYMSRYALEKGKGLHTFETIPTPGEDYLSEDRVNCLGTQRGDKLCRSKSFALSNWRVRFD